MIFYVQEENSEKIVNDSVHVFPKIFGGPKLSARKHEKRRVKSFFFFLAVDGRSNFFDHADRSNNLFFVFHF